MGPRNTAAEATEPGMLIGTPVSSPLEETMNDISKAIVVLGDLVGQLDERLRPVSTDLPKAPGTDEARPARGNSPAVQQAREHLGGVLALQDKVSSMIHGLEV